MKRVLNLYAGLGGNRSKWGDEYEVTAVEYDPSIAAIYADLYPNDTVIVGDALEYLVNHYHEFDFIWASPPCPTHSQYRYNVGVLAKGFDPVIPDMTSLYGIITFLKHHYDGVWAVENVRPYYEPLIAPTAKVGRHLIWASFHMYDYKAPALRMSRKNKISEMEEAVGLDLSDYKIPNKRQLLRNCVSGDEGLYVLRQAFGVSEWV